MFYRLLLILCLLSSGLDWLGCEPKQACPTNPPVKPEQTTSPPLLPKPVPEVRERTVQILFNKPENVKIYWDVTKAGAFDSLGLAVPGRQNFPANALYRLRMTNLPGQQGKELFPTLEIAPAHSRTDKYLTANAIPVQLTAEDLEHVGRGGMVTKVIYVPDEEFADVTLTKDGTRSEVDTLVSYLLDPGVDPITEADRRGAILAVIRVRNETAVVPDSLTESPRAEAAGIASPSHSSSLTANSTRRRFARPWWRRRY